MEQGNKGGTLDPVEPTNRHRNARRQVLRILTSSKPGTNLAVVVTTQRQEEARREAGAEKLPERGSHVGVQQTLHQEEAGREAGAEKLPERGSPVGVQQTHHQEEAGAENFPERGNPVESED